MAISNAQMSLTVAAFGALSFILGIIAENKKPASGTPITGKGVVICKYPSDPTVALGFLSVAFLAVSAILGVWSVFYPYKGKSVPRNALFRSTTMVVFFGIALAVSVMGAGMLLWASITEHLHLSRKVHHNLNTGCPTAKTGLFGGAAFLALDAALFWLICQMLTHNARADYLEEEDPKGEYGQVLATNYETAKDDHASDVLGSWNLDCKYSISVFASLAVLPGFQFYW
ncbi:hypothetical protein HHK36_013437 [Tetracentron sinense]|uniref:Uncharacterized protein n=1 Tax=Tetracentron sinense TaxID=13715 RepID=A0A835DEF1_TETSI|nr:hypothetical protein HHK36_013437 [Tetracentron sinense]